VQKAMAKKKDERYASATDMIADLNALLEDPTHSTERAKITGPRRKVPPKSSARYVVWVGGVAVIVAAVAFTVKMMQSDPVAAVPPDAAKVVQPIDAAPVATVDAAPVIPEAELIEIEILSTPTGATIVKDGVEQEGVTPLKIKVVKSNKEVELVAKLANHHEKLFKFNPLEVDPKKLQQRVILEKVKPGVRPIQVVPKAGSGSGATPGPDGLGGFPGGGTVPKK
jgi:hypothetical protein